MIASLEQVVSRHAVGVCLECGKCSAVCPVTRWETRRHASPRQLAEKAVAGNIEQIVEDPLLWSCLACQRCSQLCPAGIDFAAFLREVRAIARQSGRQGACTHGQLIQTWGQIMAAPHLRQDRLGWLNAATAGDLHTSADSDTLLFLGCLPHYQAAFGNLGVEAIQIARAALKCLNHLGIAPQVLADERCCGHDALWQGDLATFRALAERNLEQFKTSQVKRIVTACPECARTLKIDYLLSDAQQSRSAYGAHGLEVLHLSELLAQSELRLAPPGRLPSDLPAQRVAYQDACRLGRGLGIYDPPRKLLRALGYELVEMPHARQESLCCGTSCWTACGRTSQKIQLERLQEASDVGASLLVTTCVKCQIHFKCAQADPALPAHLRIEIRDLATLVGGRLACNL
jgi:Fe-S oxidoreductase